MTGPRVLVAYGSRNGSTAEIAQAIAGRLRARGLATDLLTADQVGDVGHYDAVLVGSCVYMLRWHADVLAFLHAHERALATRDVWLFQSGPLDDLPETRDRPLAGPVQQVADRIGIREHVIFGGRLCDGAAGALESLFSLGGLAGDHREWPRIDAWADAVAEQILARRVAQVLVPA
ncbi:MAG: flavodoxin domain-containing protein [Chloroflexi bacterium]|nr:flavodoxin domain-containing protein [Chloroflexota bacterium]